MISIKGLAKADVLRVLYNNSKIQGFVEQMVRLKQMEYPVEMTSKDTQEILDNMGEEKYFDCLNGKAMEVDLTSDFEFNEWGYDRDNGQGAAQKAIDLLKAFALIKYFNASSVMCSDTQEHLGGCSAYNTETGECSECPGKACDCCYSEKFDSLLDN